MCLAKSDWIAMETIEDVYRYLNMETCKYLDCGKKVSPRISALSKKTGCSRSTLQRVAQYEMNNMRPETIFPLLKFYLGLDKALDIMEVFFKKWFRVYGHTYRETRKEVSLPQDNWNSIKNELLDLAATSGFTEDWALSQLGQRGLSEAEELVAKGIFKKEADVYTTTNSSFFEPNSVMGLTRIEMRARAFDHSNVGDGHFWHLMSDLVSERCEQKLTDILRTFITDFEAAIEEDKLVPLREKTKLMTLSLFGYFKEKFTGVKCDD